VEPLSVAHFVDLNTGVMEHLGESVKRESVTLLVRLDYYSSVWTADLSIGRLQRTPI